MALACIHVMVASNALSQEKPSLREIDRVRLAEAFNLADKLGDDLWSGWSKAPFAVAPGLGRGLLGLRGDYLHLHRKPDGCFVGVALRGHPLPPLSGRA